MDHTYEKKNKKTLNLDEIRSLNDSHEINLGTSVILSESKTKIQL